MTEPDIASKIDRQRLAAYERLQDVNADLLAALEATIKWLDAHPDETGWRGTETGVQILRAEAKAKGIKE